MTTATLKATPKDNTHSEQASLGAPAQLAKTFEALHHFRTKKRDYPRQAIPDTIWRSIIQLGVDSDYSQRELERIFNVTAQQFDAKYKQFFPKSLSPKLLSDIQKRKLTVEKGDVPVSKETPSDKTQAPHINFCRADVKTEDTIPELTPSLKEKAKGTQATIKQLASSKNALEPKYQGIKTAMAEFVRADGSKCVLHLTQEAIPNLIHSFLSNTL